MAAAAIFGTLAGLGELGEQQGEARQIANQELIERLAAEQQKQAFQTQQQEATMRRQLQAQQLQAGKQLVPVGPVRTAPGGQQYQRYQNPLTGELTVQQLTGPGDETPEEAAYRGLTAIGISPEDARARVEQMYAKTPGGTRVGYQPDPNNPGMSIATVYSYDGTPQYQYSTVAPASSQPTYSTTTGQDMWGNDRTSTTVRGRGTPPVQQQQGPPPRFAAPQMQMGAPGGAAAALGLETPAPFRPSQQGTIWAKGPNNSDIQITPNAATNLTTGQVTPSLTPGGVAAAGAPGAPATGTAGVLPLDQYGNVPSQPGLTEDTRSIVNALRRNPASIVPPAARPKVFEWMQKYDPTWTPSTKLPAGSTKLIEQVQPVLDQVQRLRDRIVSLGLANNNQRMFLARDRIEYATGKLSPAGTLGRDIAGLSLGSLVEGASVLQGVSRSMPALDKALEHTPNAWVDSPAMIYSKLGEIQQRLQDALRAARDPSSFLSTPGATNPAGGGATTAQPTASNPLGLPDLPAVP
jgi:hypothetical protein